jgi:acylglycerol lipase
VKELRDMKHLQGNFTGARHSRTFYQAWLPEAEPKAILLVVHGLGEHSGRYLNLVNHFIPLGYGVYALDHFGHGQSDGPRKHVERFGDYTTTLQMYVERVRGWQPDKQIFLIGHSMGGLIATAYLLDHQAQFAGAVLSGPAVKVPDDVSPLTIFVGQALAAAVPRFALLGLETGAISRDPAVVQAYVNDPLVYNGKATARLAAEMLKTIRRVGAEASALKLPLLILQGSADRLVDPAGAQQLYDAAGSTDKTLKVYPGLYHELYNEPERDEVLHDVQHWLEGHLVPPA